MTSKNENTPEVKRDRKSSGKSGSRSRDRHRAVQVVVRNMSVFSIHRRLLGLVVIATLLLASTIIVAVSISLRKTPPQYIQVLEDSRLLPVSSLAKPNMDEAGISGFALQAIKALNTYDYLNWKDQLNNTQIYFTPDGWGKYKEELQRVGTIRAVEERRQIVTYRPNGAVRVVNEGVGPDGLYTWDVEVPSIVSYVAHLQQVGSSTGSNRQEINIRLRIKRIPSTLSPSGVAISGYGYTLTK